MGGHEREINSERFYCASGSQTIRESRSRGFEGVESDSAESEERLGRGSGRTGESGPQVLRIV